MGVWGTDGIANMLNSTDSLCTKGQAKQAFINGLFFFRIYHIVYKVEQCIDTGNGTLLDCVALSYKNIPTITSLEIIASLHSYGPMLIRNFKF